MTETYRVMLYGGPWHGRRVPVEGRQTSLRVAISEPRWTEWTSPSTPSPATAAPRTGSYLPDPIHPGVWYWAGEGVP